MLRARGKHGKSSLGLGGRLKGGRCHFNQVCHNIIKLGLGVEEVGQRQKLIVMGVMLVEMGKQMRELRAKRPVNWKVLIRVSQTK